MAETLNVITGGAEFSRLQPLHAWQGANRAFYGELREFGVTRFREGWSETNFFWRIPPEPLEHWWGKDFWGTPMDWYGGTQG